MAASIAFVAVVAVLFVLFSPAVMESFRPKVGTGEGGADSWRAAIDSKALITTRGKVDSVEHSAPQIGRPSSVEVVLRGLGGEVFRTVLGPDWYVDNQDRQLSTGDEVEVHGVRREREGVAFLVAASVTRGNKVFLLREPDGTPKWAAWRDVGSEVRGQ